MHANTTSWQAIPGGQFLVHLRKGKGKRKQSDGLIVMYFFDWVVGVIQYGLPTLSDSEDRVIGREIPEGGRFLVGNSICGVVFLCCAALRFDSWQVICVRESIDGDVRIFLIAHPPLLPALLPAPLRPPPPPPVHTHCWPLHAQPLPAGAQRQQSMFLRMGAGRQYVNKNHWRALSFYLCKMCTLCTLPRSLSSRSTSSYSDKKIVAVTAIHLLHVGWRNFFFQLCRCVSILVMAGNSFRCY
jgi:hypothetical protein